jgi:hypothetical protein
VTQSPGAHRFGSRIRRSCQSWSRGTGITRNVLLVEHQRALPVLEHRLYDCSHLPPRQSAVANADAIDGDAGDVLGVRLLSLRGRVRRIRSLAVLSREMSSHSSGRQIDQVAPGRSIGNPLNPSVVRVLFQPAKCVRAYPKTNVGLDRVRLRSGQRAVLPDHDLIPNHHTAPSLS